MHLAIKLFTLCVSLTFVPLDSTLILSADNRHNNRTKEEDDQFRHGSNSSSSSTSSSSSSSTELIRHKRSFFRPQKWEAIMNAIDHKPKSRPNTRFYLYTRHNPTKAQELCIDDLPLLRRSHFRPERRTILLVSGWLDNRFFAKWVREGISALLRRGDFNVIYVAWKSINELFVAAMIIKKFSMDLADFLIFLKRASGISGESVHCIGHSLGAFLCGFTGDKTYLGRISVLDAGPRPWYEPLPPFKRIHRHQAGFVDVIHSDFHPKFSLGLTIPLGDVDFYPNEGTIQRGCMRDKWSKGLAELKDEGLMVSLFQSARYIFFCSHYRSHEWYFESIWNRQCQFVGVLCPNYQMFNNGECGCEDLWSDGHADSTCAVMGFDADHAKRQGVTKYSPQARWHLRTSDFVEHTNQHCEFQYQLVIKLGDFYPRTQNGTMVMTILGRDERNKVKMLTQEVIEPRRPGLRANYQVTKLILRPTPIPLARVTGITLSLRPNGAKPSGWSYVSVEWVKLSPIQATHNAPLFFCHLDHSLHYGTSSLLHRCPTT